MRRLVRRALGVMLAAPLSISAQPVSSPQTMVVTAAHLIDVLKGTVVDDPQVLITDGRIVNVGYRGDAAPADARRCIDLDQRILLPGLLDVHKHLTSDPPISGYRGLEFTDNFWMIVGVAMQRRRWKPASSRCAMSARPTTTRSP